MNAQTAIDFVIDKLETGNGITFQNIKNDTGNCHAFGYGELVGPFPDPSCNNIGTNWGISGRLYSKLKNDKTGKQVTETTMRNMTRSEAVSIYKSEFWDKYRVAEIQDDNMQLIVFSYIIHSPARAVKTLQRVLNDTFGESLAVDGAIGNLTIAATNRAIRKNTTLLYQQYHDATLEFYKNHPTFAKAFQHRLSKVDSYVNTNIEPPTTTEKATDAVRTWGNSLATANFRHTWQNWAVLGLGVVLVVVLVSRQRMAYAYL